jgi:hypothetical protein
MPAMKAVGRYLDVSSRHITAQDRALLSEYHKGGTAPVWVEDHEYGWWVWVSEDPYDQETYDFYYKPAGFSEHLFEVLRLAQSLRCSFVKFDQDAPLLSELPIC